MNRVIVFAGLCMFAVGCSAVASMTVTVSAKACPFFAGQGNDIFPFYGHYGAEYSHSLPPWIDVSGLTGPISITASGLWHHFTTHIFETGPEGFGPNYPQFATLPVYSELGGISAIDLCPLNVLVGVFLTDAPPSPDHIPPSLTYGDDMTTPALQQCFAIGAGIENLIIPDGATRLFFGHNDGSDWWDNSGSVVVTVIPEPVTLLLLSAGTGLLRTVYRRREN